HLPSPSMKGSRSWRSSLTRARLERDFVARLLLTSCLIRQPLAFRTNKRAIRASFIIDSNGFPVISSKIELGQIQVQMGLAHVLIDADEAALEYRKEAFQRVGVNIAPDILALGVIDARMFKSEAPVNPRPIGIEAAFRVKMLPERRANGVVIEEYRADMPAALDETQHLPILARRRILRAAGLRRAGDKRLVGFHRFSG